MQSNILAFTAPISAPPLGFVHQADAALRACHELSVAMVTKNPGVWLGAATTAWSRCAALGRGTSRRELDSLRVRLLRLAMSLRGVAGDDLPEGSRDVAAAAARKVEAAAMLVRVRIEGRA